MTAPATTHRIGRQHVADLLADFAYAKAIDTHFAHIPAGFQPLGSGSWRLALLGPDDTVYKVEVGDTGAANVREALYWEMAARHEEWAPYVPAHRTFTVGGTITVMAMERLAVSPSPVPEDIRDMAWHIGCGDASRGNVGYRADGTAALLDAAGLHPPTRRAGCGNCNPLNPEWKGNA